MTVERLREIAERLNASAHECAGGSNREIAEKMQSSFTSLAADICERQEKIIDRLDRLIALGERDDG